MLVSDIIRTFSSLERPSCLYTKALYYRPYCIVISRFVPLLNSPLCLQDGILDSSDFNHRITLILDHPFASMVPQHKYVWCQGIISLALLIVEIDFAGLQRSPPTIHPELLCSRLPLNTVYICTKCPIVITPQVLFIKSLCHTGYTHCIATARLRQALFFSRRCER